MREIWKEGLEKDLQRIREKNYMLQQCHIGVTAMKKEWKLNVTLSRCHVAVYRLVQGTGGLLRIRK